MLPARLSASAPTLQVKVHPSSLASQKKGDGAQGAFGFEEEDGAVPTILAFEEMVRGDAATCVYAQH